jgi:hypothetical protein
VVQEHVPDSEHVLDSVDLAQAVQGALVLQAEHLLRAKLRALLVPPAHLVVAVASNIRRPKKVR